MKLTAEMHAETREYSTRTFGLYASVRQIDTTLDLAAKVEHLPQGGNILNLGAGLYLGVNALIHTIRPDVTIYSLDAGFSDQLPAEDQLLEPEDEAYIRVLTGTEPKRGNSIIVPELAEEMSLTGNSIDFTFSHSAVPENMLPVKSNYDSVLSELARVGRRGSSLILGPHLDSPHSLWAEAVRQDVGSGKFIDGHIDDVSVEVDGRLVHGYVTRLIV